MPSPRLSWPYLSSCSLFSLRGAPIWAPALLPWALFWAVAALSSAPSLASTPVGPSSWDGFPFPLLTEHSPSTLGGSSSPAWGTWPPDWKVGMAGGHAALPPGPVSFAASLPGPAWAGVCLGPAFGPDLPSWG